MCGGCPSSSGRQNPFFTRDPTRQSNYGPKIKLCRRRPADPSFWLMTSNLPVIIRVGFRAKTRTDFKRFEIPQICPIRYRATAVRTSRRKYETRILDLVSDFNKQLYPCLDWPDGDYFFLTFNDPASPTPLIPTTTTFNYDYWLITRPLTKTRWNTD